MRRITTAVTVATDIAPSIAVGNSQTSPPLIPEALATVPIAENDNANPAPITANRPTPATTPAKAAKKTTSSRRDVPAWAGLTGAILKVSEAMAVTVPAGTRR
jgi:hypothetical protein